MLIFIGVRCISSLQNEIVEAVYTKSRNSRRALLFRNVHQELELLTLNHWLEGKAGSRGWGGGGGRGGCVVISLIGLPTVLVPFCRQLDSNH